MSNVGSYPSILSGIFTEVKSHRVLQPQMKLILHVRFTKSDSHLGHRLRHFDAAAAGKGVGELLCVGGLQPEVQLLGQVLAQLRQHPPVHTHAAISSLDIYGVSNFACVAGAPKQVNTRRKAAEQNCASLALPSCSRTAHSDAQSGLRSLAAAAQPDLLELKCTLFLLTGPDTMLKEARHH